MRPHHRPHRYLASLSGFTALGLSLALASPAHSGPKASKQPVAKPTPKATNKPASKPKKKTTVGKAGKRTKIAQRRPTLEVEVHSGEFQNWAKTKTVAPAATLRFRFSQGIPTDADRVSWQASLKPFSDTRPAGKAGTTTAPPSGTGVFEIDAKAFGIIPVATKVRKLYVRVRGRKGNEGVGRYSNTVVITIPRPKVDYAASVVIHRPSGKPKYIRGGMKHTGAYTHLGGGTATLYAYTNGYPTRVLGTTEIPYMVAGKFYAVDGPPPAEANSGTIYQLVLDIPDDDLSNNQFILPHS